ncbi:hypothetical protein [Paraburkholderia pallida]|uniref:Terminase small subunit n=1 Tax=Paraburkholderia pallida TaxID=2547399 RepID=A0A4P7CQM7_9BURK|nr:hypothetical protein [Paraburkholderia pallida]QBQ98178.1 hypothetical protein E1956_14005 [Paraburkholderia pallida]
MSEMSQREFGRLVGVTHRAVQKAIEAKRISLNARGKIDSETALAEWNRNTDESKRSFTDLARQANAPAATLRANGTSEFGQMTDDPADADDTFADAEFEQPAAATTGTAALAGSDPWTSQYRASRAGREKTRHERELLELAQLRGSLISVAEAQRLAFTALRTVRDAVMNVAVRVKDELAAETDEARIQQRLEDELASALGAVDSDRILREIEAEEIDGGD